MNPVMERLFEKQGITVKMRQVIGFTPLPQKIDLYLQYLHQEMWICFKNGHDFAAIVSACALLEYALKDATYFQEFLNDNKRFKEAKWARVDRLVLDKLVREARTKRVITAREQRRIQSFRSRIRNKWLHCAEPAMLRRFPAEEILEIQYDPVKVRKIRRKIGKFGATRRIARIALDRQESIRIVRFVDKEVRLLHKRCERWNSRWMRCNGENAPTSEQLRAAFAEVERKYGKKALNNLSIVSAHLPPTC